MQQINFNWPKLPVDHPSIQLSMKLRNIEHESDNNFVQYMLVFPRRFSCTRIISHYYVPKFMKQIKSGCKIKATQLIFAGHHIL